jgi:predicted anti-sigma-YlaC factor YlaD
MTHQHELTCGECFNEVDRFAEMELTGKNAAEAMPLVKEHLERCGNCREEYEALLAALKAIAV